MNGMVFRKNSSVSDIDEVVFQHDIEIHSTNREAVEMHKTDSRKDLKDWLKLLLLQVIIVVILVAVKFI